MNGRVYDPFIARFMSPDPFTQDPGNLQGYNRYSYVLNNPMKYVDPSGYRTISMQEAIYYLLNSSEHGGTWTSTGGGGGEVNDFSNSDHAFMAGAGYLNQHNAWGENGNNSSFKAYNAYYVSKGGKTNVKAISRNDYTLNNPGTDYFERHFDHFEFDNISNSNILFAKETIDRINWIAAAKFTLATISLDSRINSLQMYRPIVETSGRIIKPGTSLWQSTFKLGTIAKAGSGVLVGAGIAFDFLVGVPRYYKYGADDEWAVSPEKATANSFVTGYSIFANPLAGITYFGVDAFYPGGWPELMRVQTEVYKAHREFWGNRYAPDVIGKF